MLCEGAMIYSGELEVKTLLERSQGLGADIITLVII